MRSIIYFVFVLLLYSACTKTPEANPETQPEQNRAFSETYQPPAFTNDQRIAKIQSLAPALKSLIEKHQQERYIPGVAYGIVVDDSLVLASSVGLASIAEDRAATTTTAFRIASMTKSFTAMAILKLRDEGKLSLEDPAEKYIPEMAGLEYLTTDAPVIDIENLLTMTAGFPEDNPWGDRQLDEPDQMLLDLMSGGVAFSNVPSYAYEYSNTGYALLGHIISKVSGMPYQQYITENILLPLGMTHTYWEIDDVPREDLAIGYRYEDDQWKLEPMLHDGSYGSMGGLITTIEDFSKYVGFHLSAWPPRNTPDNGPVRRSSLREMHTPQFPRLNAGATNYAGEPCPVMSGYGYGLGITNYCNTLVRVSHGGALPGFGSNYAFYPEYGIGIMAFGNRTYTTPYPYDEIANLIFNTLDLSTRKLPVSTVLKERQEQVVRLIQSWDETLENELLAENFYLDESRESRMDYVNGLLDQLGEIQSVGRMEPENQLRGKFDIKGENGILYVYFTLTPEKEARVQQLKFDFEASEF